MKFESFSHYCSERLGMARFRSQGGGDEPENLAALCAAHHLHGVHRGSRHSSHLRGTRPGGR
jgi:hypothetical protein